MKNVKRIALLLVLLLCFSLPVSAAGLTGDNTSMLHHLSSSKANMKVRTDSTYGYKIDLYYTTDGTGLTADKNLNTQATLLDLVSPNHLLFKKQPL